MAVDRIKRLAPSLTVPELPKLAAIVSALGRRDLLLIASTWDREAESWRKQLQLQMEQSISAARNSSG